MRSVRLAAAAALTLFALVACSNGKPPAPDTGVAACQAALASYQSGDQSSEVPPEIIANLKASNNADLKAVGDAFEQLNKLDSNDPNGFEHLGEIIAALQKLGTGCAAVGVPLPSEMVQPIAG